MCCICFVHLRSVLYIASGMLFGGDAIAFKVPFSILPLPGVMRWLQCCETNLRGRQPGRFNFCAFCLLGLSW